VPVLSWLFSEKDKRLENRKLVILISPQLAPVPQAAAPLSAETVKTQEEANTPVEKRDRK
jgi:type II secretory pathway component GspD/PulD (secretin)